MLHIERCRTGRVDEHEVLDAWRGLVAGRWSIVDRFESDGRRYLVARPNDPELGDPRGLTRSEHQVAELVGLGRSNKQIAYALGISRSAVSLRLRDAMTKLGLSGPSPAS